MGSDEQWENRSSVLSSVWPRGVFQLTALIFLFLIYSGLSAPWGKNCLWFLCMWTVASTEQFQAQLKCLGLCYVFTGASVTKKFIQFLMSLIIFTNLQVLLISTSCWPFFWLLSQILVRNFEESNHRLPFHILPENISSITTLPLTPKTQMISAAGYKSQIFYIVWRKRWQGKSPVSGECYRIVPKH